MRRALWPANSASISYLRTLQSFSVFFLNHQLVLWLFSRCTYTNYARLVTLSFGFQKAFYRGFEADNEVFTKARNLLRHAVIAKINANPTF
jgi:hypothetical protein